MVSLHVSNHSTINPNLFPSLGNIYLEELWLLGHMEFAFNCYAEGSGCLNGRRSCGGVIVQYEYYSNSFWNITALAHSVTQFSFNK